MEWHDVDPADLFAAIRAQGPPPDAERMVWALEHMIAGARVDPDLLDHLAYAAVCALAYRDRRTPREVLDEMFRRSPTDECWRADFASLLAW